MEHPAAFNQGCDARLEGLPITDCPYAFHSGPASSWRTGWIHVERYWSVDARWPVLALPEVKEQALTAKGR